MPRRKVTRQSSEPPAAPPVETPRPVGRPRALTDEKKRQVLAFIAGGGSRKKAGEYVGVSVTTIADEARRDDDFADRLSQAEASCYYRHLQNVSRAGERDWRASAFLMERKWPEEFSKAAEMPVEAPLPPLPRMNITVVRTYEEVMQLKAIRENAQRLGIRLDNPEETVPSADRVPPPHELEAASGHRRAIIRG
jgi:hypothetical protein